MIYYNKIFYYHIIYHSLNERSKKNTTNNALLSYRLLLLCPFSTTLNQKQSQTLEKHYQRTYHHLILTLIWLNRIKSKVYYQITFFHLCFCHLSTQPPSIYAYIYVHIIFNIMSSMLPDSSEALSGRILD